MPPRPRGGMGTSQIIGRIESIVESSGRPYPLWVVGVTDDPARREKEHRRDNHNTSRWRHWNAGTEEDARRVEAYFIVVKKMRGGTGGSGSADYVYFFRTPAADRPPLLFISSLGARGGGGTRESRARGSCEERPALHSILPECKKKQAIETGYRTVSETRACTCHAAATAAAPMPAFLPKELRRPAPCAFFRKYTARVRKPRRFWAVNSTDSVNKIEIRSIAVARRFI